MVVNCHTTSITSAPTASTRWLWWQRPPCCTPARCFGSPPPSTSRRARSTSSGFPLTSRPATWSLAAGLTTDIRWGGIATHLWPYGTNHIERNLPDAASTGPSSRNLSSFFSVEFWDTTSCPLKSNDPSPTFTLQTPAIYFPAAAVAKYGFAPLKTKNWEAIAVVLSIVHGFIFVVSRCSSLIENHFLSSRLPRWNLKFTLTLSVVGAFCYCFCLWFIGFKAAHQVSPPRENIFPVCLEAAKQGASTIVVRSHFDQLRLSFKLFNGEKSAGNEMFWFIMRRPVYPRATGREAYNNDKRMLSIRTTASILKGNVMPWLGGRGLVLTFRIRYNIFRPNLFLRKCK